MPCVGDNPALAYTSFVWKYRSRLVTVRRCVTQGRSSARRAVFPNKVSPSGRSMNGFGAASRESGHKRVPAPPERINGISLRATIVTRKKMEKIVKKPHHSNANARCRTNQDTSIRRAPIRVLQAVPYDA